MAEVCLAKSFGVEGFQKTVAIKTILPHISEDENFVIMFIDEAKIAARLQHANICQVFDFGKISDDFGEHLYQVMEYIPGFSLKHLARTFWDKKQQVPVGAALHVIARVCEGLDYAHALPDRDGRPLGIVHRDVTPANILVSVEGAVKLIDFGIAKAAQRETKTQAGIVKGKFGYMTPEQLQGKTLDGRSDIFSLGVGLWELLAGRILFNEPNELDNLRKIMNGDYPDIREIRDDLPDEIADVVMKALAHDRERRYPSAEEFAQDINQAAFKTRNFWNTTSLEKFIREHFPREVEAEAEKRSKYAGIRKEDFLKYPSVTDLGKQRLEEAEELDAGDLELEEAEELEEVEDDDEESGQDRTVVSRAPQKKPAARPASREVSGVTPPVSREDVRSTNFSGSLDLDAPRREANRQQSAEYPTFTLEPKPRKADPPPANEGFNPRATGAPGAGQANAGYAGANTGFPTANAGFSGANTGFPTANAGFSGANAGFPTGEQDYPAYLSPYGELSAQNNSFINEPSMPPEESFADETAAYRPGSAPSMPAQGYYGEDGQWYPYTQSQQVQGYYGEDGQWYPYTQQQQQTQGYYGEDGQWYPYTPAHDQGYYGEDGRWYPYDQQQQQQPQGYYGEDGQWYSYDQQQQQPQGYYGEDGQWYPYDQPQQPQGYYGEDGQWHAYPNPYYQSTHSYPDYSYPDHSRPDLPGMTPPLPPKKR